jgi:hypothetical protein
MAMSKAKQPTRDELRQRIIHRCRKVVRDCEQALRDIAYWQRLHPRDANALDDQADEFRRMKQYAESTLEQFKAK